MNELALEVIRRNSCKAGLAAACSGPATPDGHLEYVHVWPRDAALVALELAHCDAVAAAALTSSLAALQRDNGLLFQRYELNGRPDERTWCNFNCSRQLDQDALVLLSAYKTKVVLPELKSGLEALFAQVEARLPCTDVWEQKQGYFFYSTCALACGLAAAGKMIKSERSRCDATVRRLAESLDCFWDNELRCFTKTPDGTVDFEVALGIALVLEYKPFAPDFRFLCRVLLSLGRIENELAARVGNSFALLRYKEDFWDGERVGAAGIGRPWPMGNLFVSEAYSLLAIEFKQLKNKRLDAHCSKKAGVWLAAAEAIPGFNEFPEQVGASGFAPPNSPKQLSWCAAEYLKALRLLALSRQLNSARQAFDVARVARTAAVSAVVNHVARVAHQVMAV